MGLLTRRPEPSSRMGMAWALRGIQGLAVLEFGSMGHTIYQEKYLQQQKLEVKALYCSTHMDEKDIALGDWSRVIKAMKTLEARQDIKGIALLPSSIGEMIGMDLSMVKDQAIDSGINIPITVLDKGGLQYKVKDGWEEALYQLIYSSLENEEDQPSLRQKVTKQRGNKEAEKPLLTYNLIGAFGAMTNAKDLIRQAKKIMGPDKKCHLKLLESMKFLEISSLIQADLNIVLSKEGLKSAKWLKKEFDMAYEYMELEIQPIFIGIE